MNLKRLFEHYQEEMNYEVMWDIMLFRTDNLNDRMIIKESTNRYWGADPFLFSHSGKNYLFYEQYDIKRKKGVIAYREVNEVDLQLGEATVVIEESFHMSFPYIFYRNDEIYMIPETSAIKEVRIYHAEQFPKKWTFEKTIVFDFPGVDTIVLENSNSLILHTSIGDSCNVENYILECDNSFTCGKKIKVKNFSERGNRNAGKTVKRNEKVYRIGQDCSGKEYGKGLIVYELLTNIKEIEVTTVSHKSFSNELCNYCGVHTYNEMDGMSVVDLKYLVKKSFYKKVCFIVEKAWNVIRRKVKRI